MVATAVQLSWNMVTLVPPAVIFQPNEYKEDWHDKRITYWKEISSNSLIYFCPIFFYSSSGRIGCKGVIGNEFVNDYTIIKCHNAAVLNSNEL